MLDLLRQILAAFVGGLVDGTVAPKGFQRYALNNLTPSTNLTTITSGSNKALIVVEGAAIRWRDDGTNPNTIGMPLQAGDSFWYTGDLTAIRFVGQAPGAAINISYYR